jgi:hypothetical protein
MEQSMADDLKNRGPKDRSRVNTSEKWELDYWSKELGVSSEKLKELVGRVGPSVEKIRAAVRQHKGQ